MAGRKKAKGDVSYYAPGRKKPVAYSTVAAGKLLALLSQGGGLTILELRSRISYDVEAIRVLDRYIELGFGNSAAEFKY
jgi:hypothetical protein